MDSDMKDYDYSNLKNQGTGSHKLPEESEEYKIITYPFDKYQVKIKLTQDNEFVEIIEIKINKEFLSYKQKISSLGYHDVDEFYRE